MDTKLFLLAKAVAQTPKHSVPKPEIPISRYFQSLAIHNAICRTRLYHSGYPKSLALLFRSADQRLSQLMVPRKGLGTR